MRNSEKAPPKMTVARMFFASSPAWNRDLYDATQQQMQRDYSPTYWFRVDRTQPLLALYRRDPAAFVSLAEEYRSQFANRAPHRLDTIETDALRSLRQNPNRVLNLVSSSLLVDRVRLLAPVIMGAACVSCHNSHPESTKRDWKVGDVRGLGLLAGIEFVADKRTKAPFPRRLKFAETFVAAAQDAGLIVWPNVGHADGGYLPTAAALTSLSVSSAANTKRSVGRPDTDSAAIAAQGPGTV